MESGAIRETEEGSSPYAGVIDLRVRNNSHTIAYNLIEETALGRRWRILEVGCGTGYFGEALKLAGHELWGVDVSSAAAAVAQRRLDHVVVGSVEDFFKGTGSAQPGFDCITYGDVLEHLIDPQFVLARSLAHITDDGVVVASIPNVAHMAVRLMLLEGRWDYSDRGILDRTHLHFFTRRSILDLFSSAGYWVEALSAVRLPVDLTGIEVSPELARSVRHAVTDDASDVFQYLVLARRATASRPASDNARFLPGNGRKVLCLMPVADWSLGDIRLRNPLKKWTERHGGEVRVKWVGAYEPADIAWSDVVVLQREADPFVIALIDECHRWGKRVVFDIDDLLTEVPAFLSTHEHAARARGFLVQALGMVDAVTVTTGRLRAQLGQYQRVMHVVRNCPSLVHPKAGDELSTDGAVTLLVASTDTVRTDFIVPALKTLLSDPSLRFNVIGIGPPGGYLRDAGIPAQCVDQLGYDEFLAYIGSLRNAIGLIPLDDSVFSGCKSPIKFLDYALAGVVSVCSRVPPYSDVVTDGLTGLLVDNTAEAWCAAVGKLAVSSELRARLCGEARAFCNAQYGLKQAADAWHLVFADVMSREPAPPQPVHQRVPRATVLDLIRLFLQPATYRSAARIFRRDGWQGVEKRMKRLYGLFTRET